MATQDSPSFKSLGFSVVEVQTLIFTSASMRFDDFCVEWRLNTMKRHKVPKSYVNVWSFWKELKMQCKDIYLELTLYVKLRISNIITASAAESLFTVNQKKFRQINSLVFSLVNTLLSRNFCQISVTVNFRNFHTVSEFQCAQCGNYGNSLSHYFGKNFVKVTYLLKKILKSWFDEIFFQWERISRFSTLWWCGNFWNLLSLRKNSVKSTI